MSIKYEIQSIKNSQGDGKDRLYARIYESEARTKRQLEDHIQATCGLPRGTVEAVLSALSEHMTHDLSCGRRFYLPNIGYFSLSANLDIPEGKTADKVRADYISVRNIKFRPEMSLLRNVKDKVTFERADFTTKSQEITEEEITAGLKEYLSVNRTITRRSMEQLFKLRRSTALKWLKLLTEKGVLRKEGVVNSPVYFLNCQDSSE